MKVTKSEVRIIIQYQKIEGKKKYNNISNFLYKKIFSCEEKKNPLKSNEIRSVYNNSNPQKSI